MFLFLHTSSEPHQTARLDRQACPAGLSSGFAQQAISACQAGFLCRTAGLFSRLAQQTTPASRQAFSAGQQACPAGCPAGYLCLSGRLSLQAGRLVRQVAQQATSARPAGFLCRPAGKRTGFFLKTSSARLLPQDFLFKTSSSRSPEGRLSPLQALLCCCLQTCLQ